MRVLQVPQEKRNAQLHLHTCLGPALSSPLTRHWIRQMRTSFFIPSSQAIIPLVAKPLSTCLKTYSLSTSPSPTLHFCASFSFPSSLDLRLEQSICSDDEVQSVILIIQLTAFHLGPSPAFGALSGQNFVHSHLADRADCRCPGPSLDLKHRGEPWQPNSCPLNC